MDLFVDGLPSSFGRKELTDLFGGFGTVLAADVVKNKEGGSLQFGFVKMATSREAYRAMASLHRSIVDDHLLLVTLAESQSARCSQYSPHDTSSRFA